MFHPRFNFAEPLTVALLGAVAGFVGMVGVSRSVADEPTQVLTERSSDSESIDVRYARAHLELAKLDLRRAQAIADEFPTVDFSRSLEGLKRHVDVDEEQLTQAKKFPDSDLHQIHIRSAEVAVELAESDLQRKRKAHKILPTLWSAIDAERAAAVAEVAKLNLERTRAQEASLSSLRYLQWQIENLRNDLLELQVAFETRESR